MRRKLSLICACLFIHMYTLQERLSRVYTDVLWVENLQGADQYTLSVISTGIVWIYVLPKCIWTVRIAEACKMFWYIVFSKQTFICPQTKKADKIPDRNETMQNGNVISSSAIIYKSKEFNVMHGVTLTFVNAKWGMVTNLPPCKSGIYR